MRDDHASFTSRSAVILAIGPDNESAFQEYWAREKIPYIGIPDPTHAVAKLYKQQIILFKLGRMPLVCILDAQGFVRYVHYGRSMSDIPTNETLLQVIDGLNASSK